MATHKISRLAEDIRRELTDVMRSVKDPRVNGLLSIVRVDLSGDMSHCKVFVSSMDGIESARESVQGLNSAAGFIRREINARVEMRRSPAFHFVADNSIEHSADIAKLLNDLHVDDSHVTGQPTDTEDRASQEGDEE